jgi:hypothetical protein
MARIQADNLWGRMVAAAAALGMKQQPAFPLDMIDGING